MYVIPHHQKNFEVKVEVAEYINTEAAEGAIAIKILILRTEEIIEDRLVVDLLSKIIIFLRVMRPTFILLRLKVLLLPPNAKSTTTPRGCYFCGDLSNLIRDCRRYKLATDSVQQSKMASQAE